VSVLKLALHDDSLFLDFRQSSEHKRRPEAETHGKLGADLRGVAVDSLTSRQNNIKIRQFY
jgi:hypothetical protein